MRCGHFNFTVRDKWGDAWIFCSDCHQGIKADSPKGQRMLNRKRRIDKRLSKQQDKIFRSLQASYLQLIKNTGTTNPEELADYANNHPSENAVRKDVPTRLSPR